MRRRCAVVAVVVLTVGCSQPRERWQERGFESEAECWLNHGWDGTVADGTERYDLWQFWCGTIND